MSGDRLLIGVWLALLAMLALTVAASFVFSGPASLAIALTIAAGKSGLIYWFYMHLREETGLARLFALGAVAWLLILLLLSMADFLTRAYPV